MREKGLNNLFVETINHYYMFCTAFYKNVDEEIEILLFFFAKI